MNWKPLEPTLHRLMGFLAALTNTRWLWLERRERKQLPPENDRYPVFAIWPDGTCTPLDEEPTNIKKARDAGSDIYWSEARVMDTLDDLRQYDQGGTLGWFGTVGLGVLIGWWIWG